MHYVVSNGDTVFQRIIFPTDGSAASLQGALAVTRLASDQSRFSVAIAVVVSPLAAEQSDCRPRNPHDSKMARNRDEAS